MWKHVVARANHPYQPFQEFESARWFWSCLKNIFPETVSAVLMPNHLHLLLPNSSNAKGLAGLLGVLSRKQGIKRLWQPIPPPAFVPDRVHLRRQVRYIALNPCRKSLVKDPLEWYWSTYREVMGAAAECSFSADTLAEELGEKRKDFEVRLHKYVSADPSVAIMGTPPPKPNQYTLLGLKSIGEILAAAAGALRIHPTQVQTKQEIRKWFIHLAYKNGWNQTRSLAQICKMSPRAVRALKETELPSNFRAAELCLGDARLRKVAEDALRDLDEFFN